MSDVTIKRQLDGERSLPVFAELERKMDAVRARAFSLFADRGGRPGGDLDDWLAAERELMGWSTAELTERKDEFEVDVTLPGFKADDIELTATPKEIIVHAERKAQRSGETDRVVWSEFGSNDVYRRFPLPADVKVDHVTADLKNGVLRVRAPKQTMETGRTVEIAR
ncbi:MAG: Hsp20 family protein [Gemmatimonadaceae bacterium]|nr:Hsp20 family protein [Gemmatimonadaceae bacterium]